MSSVRSPRRILHAPAPAPFRLALIATGPPAVGAGVSESFRPSLTALTRARSAELPKESKAFLGTCDVDAHAEPSGGRPNPRRVNRGPGPPGAQLARRPESAGGTRPDPGARPVMATNPESLPRGHATLRSNAGLDYPDVGMVSPEHLSAGSGGARCSYFFVDI
jgi:hypothetical protein